MLHMFISSSAFVCMPGMTLWSCCHNCCCCDTAFRTPHPPPPFLIDTSVSISACVSVRLFSVFCFSLCVSLSLAVCL